MLWVKLLFADTHTIHPQGNNFVGMENKATDDSKLNNSPGTNLHMDVGVSAVLFPSILVRGSMDFDQLVCILQVGYLSIQTNVHYKPCQQKVNVI